MVSASCTFELTTFLGSLAVSFSVSFPSSCSVNLYGMMCDSLSNTVHDVSFHIVHIEVSLPPWFELRHSFAVCPHFPHLWQFPWNASRSIDVGAVMVILACSDRTNLSNKFRPAVALRGAHQKMFLHAVLAYTSNDATNLQGITDRFAALSLVDHDLPLKSSESIKDVTVKRRTQNLRQLPDHTRFAGRLVLVDQCSPSLKSFPFFVG